MGATASRPSIAASPPHREKDKPFTCEASDLSLEHSYEREATGDISCRPTDALAGRSKLFADLGPAWFSPSVTTMPGMEAQELWVEHGGTLIQTDPELEHAYTDRLYLNTPRRVIAELNNTFIKAAYVFVTPGDAVLHLIDDPFLVPYNATWVTESLMEGKLLDLGSFAVSLPSRGGSNLQQVRSAFARLAAPASLRLPTRPGNSAKIPRTSRTPHRPKKRLLVEPYISLDIPVQQLGAAQRRKIVTPSMITGDSLYPHPALHSSDVNVPDCMKKRASNPKSTYKYRSHRMTPCKSDWVPPSFPLMLDVVLAPGIQVDNWPPAAILQLAQEAVAEANNSLVGQMHEWYGTSPGKMGTLSGSILGIAMPDAVLSHTDRTRIENEGDEDSGEEQQESIEENASPRGARGMATFAPRQIVGLLGSQPAHVIGIRHHEVSTGNRSHSDGSDRLETDELESVDALCGDTPTSPADSRPPCEEQICLSLNSKRGTPSSRAEVTSRSSRSARKVRSRVVAATQHGGEGARRGIFEGTRAKKRARRDQAGIVDWDESNNGTRVGTAQDIGAQANTADSFFAPARTGDRGESSCRGAEPKATSPHAGSGMNGAARSAPSWLIDAQTGSSKYGPRQNGRISFEQLSPVELRDYRAQKRFEPRGILY